MSQLPFSKTGFSFSAIPLSLWILSVVLVCAQLSLGSQLVFGDAHVNFMVIITLLWAFSYGSRSGVAAGFFCGLIYDMTSSTSFGVMMLSLSIVGYLAGIRQLMLFRENFVVSLGAGVFACCLLEALFGIILMLTGLSTSFAGFFLYKFLPSCLFDAVFCIATFVVYLLFLSKKDSSSSYKGVRYRS